MQRLGVLRSRLAPRFISSGWVRMQHAAAAPRAAAQEAKAAALAFADTDEYTEVKLGSYRCASTMLTDARYYKSYHAFVWSREGGDIVDNRLPWRVGFNGKAEDMHTDHDGYFIFESNTRWEEPVVNTNLNQTMRDRGLHSWRIGHVQEMLHPSRQSGTTTSALMAVLEGRSASTPDRRKSRSILSIFGQGGSPKTLRGVKHELINSSLCEFLARRAGWFPVQMPWSLTQVGRQHADTSMYGGIMFHQASYTGNYAFGTKGLRTSSKVDFLYLDDAAGGLSPEFTGGQATRAVATSSFADSLGHVKADRFLKLPRPTTASRVELYLDLKNTVGRGEKVRPPSSPNAIVGHELFWRKVADVVENKMMLEPLAVRGSETKPRRLPLGSATPEQSKVRQLFDSHNWLNALWGSVEGSVNSLPVAVQPGAMRPVRLLNRPTAARIRDFWLTDNNCRFNDVLVKCSLTKRWDENFLTQIPRNWVGPAQR